MWSGYDFRAISPPGAAAGTLHLHILERQPRLYIHVQLTLFVYLERFRHYSTYFIWLGFPYWGEILGVLGQNDPQEDKISKNTCLKGTSLRQNASF